MILVFVFVPLDDGDNAGEAEVGEVLELLFLGQVDMQGDVHQVVLVELQAERVVNIYPACAVIGAEFAGNPGARPGVVFGGLAERPERFQGRIARDSGEDLGNGDLGRYGAEVLQLQVRPEVNAEDKCVADVSFTPIYDDDDNIIELQVTITDAYPYFVADISFWICNCGTIPVKIKAPTITQSPYLLIQYGDNIGSQLHPGMCAEISFFVGVTQHEGYFAVPEDPDSWIVDDPAAPLTPMDDTLTFTIEIEAIQWNEY
ncbi:hypothetical protein ES707_12777 [subsurface metagenome]